MRKFKYMLPLVICFFAACSVNQQKQDSAAEKQNALVFPQGEKITNANFKGTAYLQMLTDADRRTKWHIHPAGQILLVTDGVGYYQEKDQPKKVLHKGDVIKCPPNVPHWHGASPDSPFVQLAISGREKGPTVWLGAVKDEQYSGGL